MVADERCEPIVALCAAPSLHGWPTTALMASTRSELYAFRRTLSSKFDTPSSVYDESVGGAPTRREELSDDTGDSIQRRERRGHASRISFMGAPSVGMCGESSRRPPLGGVGRVGRACLLDHLVRPK